MVSKYNITSFIGNVHSVSHCNIFNETPLSNVVFIKTFNLKSFYSGDEMVFANIIKTISLTVVNFGIVEKTTVPGENQSGLRHVTLTGQILTPETV